MEQSYVTAAFFRHKTMQRYTEMSMASEGERALVEGGGRPAPAGDDSDSEDEEDVNSSDTGDSTKGDGKPDLSKMSAPPPQPAAVPKDDGFGIPPPPPPPPPPPSHSPAPQAHSCLSPDMFNEIISS